MTSAARSEASAIETDRLGLRPYRPADIDDLAALYADPKVTAFTRLGRQTRAQSEAILKGYLRLWRTRGLGMRALFLKRTGGFVGECGFFWHRQFRAPALRYALVPEMWGRGLTGEAVAATVTDAFARPDVDKVYSIVQDKNRASLRVMRKLGFVEERRAPDDGVTLVVFSAERGHWTAPDRHDRSAVTCQRPAP